VEAISRAKIARLEARIAKLRQKRAQLIRHVTPRPLPAYTEQMRALARVAIERQDYVETTFKMFMRRVATYDANLKSVPQPGPT